MMALLFLLLAFTMGSVAATDMVDVLTADEFLALDRGDINTNEDGLPKVPIVA